MIAQHMITLMMGLPVVMQTIQGVLFVNHARFVLSLLELKSFGTSNVLLIHKNGRILYISHVLPFLQVRMLAKASIEAR